MTSARDQAVRSRNGRRPTDDELLDAARAVFARQGSHAGSMDAIAAHAGSTKPTLYAHFSDKETLYRRALEREAATLERHLADAYAAALALPPTEQVNRDTMAFFDYAIAHPDGFALLFGPHATGVALATRDALASALRERIAAVIHHARGHHRRTLGRSAEVVPGQRQRRDRGRPPRAQHPGRRPARRG
jgi:AcrR family transcriptional regulator